MPPERFSPTTQNQPVRLQFEGLQRWLHAFPGHGLVADRNGRILMVNLACQTWLGLTNEHMIGRDIRDFVRETLRINKALDAIRNDRHDDFPVNFESDWVQKPGFTVWTLSPLKGQELGHDAVLMLGVSLAQRQAHVVDTQTQDFSERLLESLGQGMVWLNNEQRILKINTALEVLLGRASNELVGRPLFEALGLDENPRAVQGSTSLNLRHSNGQDLPVLYNSIPWDSNGGGGVLALITDLRDVRREEQRFRALAKLMSAHNGGFEDHTRQLLELAIAELGLNIGVGILARIEDNQYSVIQAVSPGDAVAINQVFTLEPGFIQETTAITEPVCYERHHSATSAWQTHPAYPAVKLEAFIAAPIWVEGRLYGTLSVFSPLKKPRGFGAADLEFMRILAAWLGSGLERETTEHNALQNQRRLRNVAGSSRDLISHHDKTGQILYASPAFAAMFGLDPTALVGAELLQRVHPDDQQQVSKQWLNSLAGLPVDAVRFRLRHQNDQEIWLESSLSVVRNAHGQVEEVYVFSRDVSQQQARLNDLERKAYVDMLTDLPNRGFFLEELRLRLQRNHTGFAVGFLDLDGFKSVNDTFGHATGDALLRLIAIRCREALQAGDLVARLSGDEFALLFDNLSTPQEAEERKSALLAHLAQPIEVSGQALRVGISIGYALCPNATVEASELLALADHAMYTVKGQGRGLGGRRRGLMQTNGKPRELHLRDLYTPQAVARCHTHIGTREELLAWLQSEFGSDRKTVKILNLPANSLTAVRDPERIIPMRIFEALFARGVDIGPLASRCPNCKEAFFASNSSRYGMCQDCANRHHAELERQRAGR